MAPQNHEHTNEDFIRNPEVTYEPRDMNTRAVVGFLMSLMIAGVFVLVVLWGVYKYLVGADKAPQPSAANTSTRQTERVGADRAAKFPEPRLQPDPVADLNKFRAREEEMLNSYWWVDKANGKVHIPIESAIDALAKSGLPTRPSGQPAQKQPAGATGAAGGINVQQGTSGQVPGKQGR